MLALAVGLPACAPRADTKDPSRPLELVVSNDAETLDPRYATDAVSLRATRLIHAGLVRLDADTLAPVPAMARAWAWIDSRTLRVELRDDARFHSGAPLAPRDVVATIRAFGSPAVKSRHARVVEAIGSVEEDGAHAVIIRLNQAHATLLTDLELPILRADQAESPPDPCGALDGLGPYAVASCEPGTLLLHRAGNPAPAHDVVIRTVHDENARAMRLYAGRTDIALNQISPTLLPAMESQPSLTITSRPGANLTYLVVRERGRQLPGSSGGWSTPGSPLDEVGVRRAISSAIDRASLTRTLLGGYATPADGVIPKTHWAHLDAPLEPALTFDPDASRRALAGFAPLHLTLLTSTDRLRISIARTIAQELEEVGVDLEVIPLALGTLLARLNAGDFDLASLQLPEFTEPHVLRNFLGSAFIPPAGPNRGRIRDAVLDALLDEGGATMGLDERRTIYARASARIVEQMHIIPLWQEDQVVVTDVRARAFVPSAEGRWLSVATVP